MSLWPPFLGAGIRVRHISPDWREVTVELRQRWYNRNYIGTHFGGSLFAMTDPFHMLMLMRHLGREYRVLDQGAEVCKTVYVRRRERPAARSRDIEAA